MIDRNAPAVRSPLGWPHATAPRKASLLLVFLLAAAPVAALPDEAAVRDLWKLFNQFYAQRDVDGLVSLYAADADRLTPGGNAHGKDQIRAQYVAELAEPGATDPPLDERITFRMLQPAVALIDGEADYRSESGVVTYYYTVVVVKIKGRWLITAGRPRGSVDRTATSH